jgi:hypothetical protein
VLLACRSEERLTAFAALRWLDWDTTHFGFSIFRLQEFAAWGGPDRARFGAASLSWAVAEAAEKHGAATVHTWMPMEAMSSIQALEDVGFRTMDIQTTWIFDHTKDPVPGYQDRCVVRGYQPGDEAVFVPLAREAYTDTPDRFHSDPHIPRQASDELYAEWIRNSCRGALADHIIVAEVNSQPAGYTTLKLEGDHGGLSNVRTGALVLSAVAPWAEGKGLYTSMINGGLKWLAGQGVEISHLGTQVNNYPVQRAWARLGFKLAKSGPSMHLWLRS